MDTRARERGDAGKALDEPLEVPENDLHPGLLEHDLGDPDPVRIVAGAPRQGALVFAEPRLGQRGETAG